MNVNLVAPPVAVAGEVTSTTITIENSTHVVRELRLTLVGIAGWADLDQHVLKLFPGDLGVATIRFQPPATPQVAAGEHPFAVRCVATDDDDVHVEESIVRVAPHSDVDVRLSPSCARTRRSASFQLTVTNEGNQRERFQLRADDANEMLELDLSAASVDLEAGRTAFIRLKARNTTAQPGEHLPFQVQVSSPTLGSRIATGSLTIRRSRLRKAIVVTAAIVGILLVAANVWSSEPTSHAVDASLPPTTVVRPSMTITPADTSPDTSVVATTLPEPAPTPTSMPEPTSTTLPAALPPPSTVTTASTNPGVPSHQPETPITTVPPAPTIPPTTPSIPIPTAPTAPPTTQATAITAPSTTSTLPKPPDYATEDFVIYFHVDPNGLFNPSSNCQMIHSPTEVSAYTSPVVAGWTIDTTKGDPTHPGISDILDGSNAQARGTLILYDYQARSANTFAVTGQVCGSSNAGPGAIFSHTYRVFLTRPAS